MKFAMTREATSVSQFGLGFLLSPGVFSRPASSFHGSVHSGLRDTIAFSTRKSQRARIVALGSTPPPPPKEPEDESESSETPASPDETAEEVTADDILNSPAFLKKKLEIVQKELIDAKAELDKDDEGLEAEKQKYLRLAADFENYRRRSMEDLRKQDAKSTAKVCKQILDVLDNFERATAAVEAKTDSEQAIAGSYQAINKQLLDALVRLKVEPLDTVGETFDPEFHEAIQRMESTEYAEDVVCTQFQRGYKIEDTLIRAAVVAVSTGPGPETPEGDDDTKGEETIMDVEGTEPADAEAKDEVETTGGK